jgi:hypothetical protein
MIPNARLIDLDGSDHVIPPHAPLVPLGFPAVPGPGERLYAA